MTDHATPNLPARDFDYAETFYSRLGFETGWKDSGWMILRRGTIMLEFFPDPALDPWTSGFGCCIRLEDLDAMVAAIQEAGVPVACSGMPRLQLPKVETSGKRIAYLVDPDGNLLRLVQN